MTANLRLKEPHVDKGIRLRMTSGDQKKGAPEGKLVPRKHFQFLLGTCSIRNLFYSTCS